MKTPATEPAEEIADIFVRNSLQVTQREFVDLVDTRFGTARAKKCCDAALMLPGLKELLPRKNLN